MFQLMESDTNKHQAITWSVCEHVLTKWFSDVFYVIAKMEQEVLRQLIGAMVTVCKYHYKIL